MKKVLDFLQLRFFLIASAILHLLFFLVFLLAAPAQKNELVSIQVVSRDGGAVASTSVRKDSTGHDDSSQKLTLPSFAKQMKSVTESVRPADTQEAGPLGFSGTDGRQEGGNENSALTVSGSDVGIVVKYPRMSRVLGEVGDVLVEVTRGEERLALSSLQLESYNEPQFRIQKSSGFSRLDEAALEATLKALHKGLLASYFQNRNQIQVSFSFRLVDEEKKTN